MNFGALALVVAAGLLGPLVASAHRFAPPVVVGQIAAGVLIGNSGLKWVHPDDPVLSGLSAIGFALLMFIVGTHLPLRDERLRPALARGAMLTATVVAGAVVGGLVLAHLVNFHRPAVIATLLTTSSGAVALPVLQGMTTSNSSTLSITAWVAIADVVSVLSLPVVLATGGLLRVLSGGVLVVAVAGVFYGIALTMKNRGPVARARELSKDRGWGLDLRISLLALFVCAWLATRFGTSILLAGFAVGAVVALLGQPRRVAQQLVGVGEGFMVPLFFVLLGAKLDLSALFHSRDDMVLAAALAAVAIVIHVGAGLLWKLPIGAGLLASAQLGVPSAVVSIGLASGQLTPAQGAAVMASVLVTLGACAVGSVLLGSGGLVRDAVAPAEPAGSAA